MVQIPKEVLDLFTDKNATKMVVSSSKDGKPHAIIAGSIGAPDSKTVVVGEVLMKKTSANLKENPFGEIVVAAGPKAYSIQVKAMERQDKGPALEGMNKALAAFNLKAGAVWIFKVCSVHDQGAGPNSGKKLA